MKYKITKKQAVALAEEEAETAKKYRKMGFLKEAKDEARHSKTFSEIAKKL